MGSLSKLLNQGLREATCQDVFHPGRTCSQFLCENTLYNLVTSMKYFLPVVGLPLLMKGKNLKKEHIKEGLMFYVEACLTGFMIAQTVPIALCGTRAVFGHYNKHNFMFIPGIIGTWPMFFTTARVARVYAASVFQMTLETIIRHRQNPISRKISQSKALQTFIFMMCSVFVMDTIQKNNLNMFWFVRTLPSPKQGQSDECTHEDTCLKSLIKELPKVFLIGISIDLLKTLIEAFTKKDAMKSSLKQKLIQLDFPTTFFISSYTTIYRLTLCLLTYTWKTDPRLKHIVASFLGGISFRFLSKLSILCFGLSICTEMSWKLFAQHKFEKNSTLLEAVKKIPFHRILSGFPIGYLVYMYVFRSNFLSPFAATIVTVMTGNRAPLFAKNIHEYLKTLE